MKKLIDLSKEELLERIWKAEPKLKSILRDAKHVEEARYVFFDYLDRFRRDLYNMKSDTPFADLNVVKKRNARECIRVLSNTMRTENEHLTQVSPLELLYDLARGEKEALEKTNEGFLLEYLALLEGIRGRYGKQSRYHELLEQKEGRVAAIERSSQLDDYGAMMKRYFRRYKTGLDPKLVKKSKKLKDKILSYFGAGEEDWQDYLWHMKHIIKDIKTLSAIVKLDDDEMEGLRLATENHIPFEITPHYLSLFNEEGRSPHDRAIRAQVIQSPRYCTNVLANQGEGRDMDFMGEYATSPIDGITRRYPQIIIVKPFNSCPQICVYCQRNWEITDIDDNPMMPKNKVVEMIEWAREDKNLSEILITGGDPFTLNNKYLDWLIGEFAGMDHIDRIRIGTRTLVTLPQRINDGLLEILEKYHEWGKREIAIVTHIEHPTEICPEVLDAVKKIKKLGINIYNQEVFTYYNSRKFETAFLRKALKVCGIDPYYTFNCQGKGETVDFRVPIARILQERKEEARLLPGLVRTDEPVFNVPRLGKSHLRAWQDHEVIMILPDGRRVYRFYSWETKLTTARDYLYTDVSLYDYFKRLQEDGENVNDYLSMLYYF
ncbi:MAG: KamA family radical SAM protein [Deltaproteobacteria bacterium]|nr:KamA family radical SAM protein [Deltaproteobacteria bacterium]MBW2595815.1 KamA family radical SAM protein [Deltaproteobacteria bacterium]MBW2650124.1 KamA family radical SAM protein [Deltaproteobacteria bacterium]